MFFALKLCTLFTCPNGFDPISSLLLKNSITHHQHLISERGVIPIIKPNIKATINVDKTPCMLIVSDVYENILLNK